jgi:hypothetical protein
MLRLKYNDTEVINASYNLLNYYKHIEEHWTNNGLLSVNNIHPQARHPEDEYLLHLLGKLQDTIHIGEDAIFTEHEVSIMNQNFNTIVTSQGHRYPDIIIYSLSVILSKLYLTKGGKRKNKKKLK